MATSLRRQCSYPAREVSAPKAIRARAAMSVTLEVLRLANWETARPPAISASAVRFQAKKVRSFASMTRRSRASGVRGSAGLDGTGFVATIVGAGLALGFVRLRDDGGRELVDPRQTGRELIA